MVKGGRDECTLSKGGTRSEGGGTNAHCQRGRDKGTWSEGGGTNAHCQRGRDKGTWSEGGGGSSCPPTVSRRRGLLNLQEDGFWGGVQLLPHSLQEDGLQGGGHETAHSEQREWSGHETSQSGQREWSGFETKECGVLSIQGIHFTSQILSD